MKYSVISMIVKYIMHFHTLIIVSNNFLIDIKYLHLVSGKNHIPIDSSLDRVESIFLRQIKRLFDTTYLQWK